MIAFRLMLRPARGSENGLGISRGAHYERANRRILLAQRYVGGWLRVLTDLQNDSVPDDSYNFIGLDIGKSVEPLAEGFLAGPHHPGHDLIFNGDLGGAFANECSEFTDVHEGNAHGIEGAR